MDEKNIWTGNRRQVKKAFEYIEWIDSAAADKGWTKWSKRKVLLPAPCQSVGFVIDETKKYITLAQNIGKSEVCGIITIPKVCVKKRRKIKSRKDTK